MEKVISKIENIVLSYFNITRDELTNKRRFARLVVARHILYYELYRLGMTEREIARTYNVCRSNVNFAKQNVTSWQRISQSIKRDIDNVERLINEERMGHGQQENR